METQTACLASDAEIKKHKRECWNPGCQKRAWIRDWKGWRWCFFHCWAQLPTRRDGHFLGRLIFELRRIKVF